MPSQSALRWLSFYLVEDMKLHDPETTGRAIWRLFSKLDVHDRCRTLPDRRITLSQEDCDTQWEPSRLAGHAVWTLVLDVVLGRQRSGAQGGRVTLGPVERSHDTAEYQSQFIVL